MSMKYKPYLDDHYISEELNFKMIKLMSINCGSYRLRLDQQFNKKVKQNQLFLGFLRCDEIVSNNR